MARHYIIRIHLRAPEDGQQFQPASYYARQIASQEFTYIGRHHAPVVDELFVGVTNHPDAPLGCLTIFGDEGDGVFARHLYMFNTFLGLDSDYRFDPAIQIIAPPRGEPRVAVIEQLRLFSHIQKEILAPLIRLETFTNTISI